MRAFLKKFIITSIFLTSCISIFSNISEAGDIQVEWFNIMPELTWWEITIVEDKITEIWATWWMVMKTYYEASTWLTTSQQIASWIMNWNTIMNYLVFIVQFLSQLGLVVWTAFIIYAWYKYMTDAFWWKSVPSKTITNAIIWILIVIFSYAIMKFLTSVIWLT